MDPDQINELSGNTDVPLAFRMMEHLPGFTSSFLFAQHRASNTLMRGGFMDDRRRGPGKLGGFKRGSMTPINPSANAYYGTASRRARLAQAAGTSEGKMALGKGSRLNHLTMRPRALSRYSSLTMFNASTDTPFYSPFQFLAGAAGKKLAKNESFMKAAYGGRELAENEQVLQRGMVSMITAGRKMDVLERKASFSATGQPQNRAARKIIKAQEQIRRVAMMNNPAIAQGATFSGGQFGRVLPKSLNRGIVLPAGQTLSIPSMIDDAIMGGQRAGLSGNLMASAGATQGSRFIQGYFRGSLGMMNAGDLNDDAMRGVTRAVGHFTQALGKTSGLNFTLDDAGKAVGRFAGIYEGKSVEALEKGVFKTLGVKRTMQAAATKQGAMVLGARTAAMAIPGLNILATASLVYDLGKMGGELVKSGVNLAKDAVKSMKGSIDKPLFGMGYKDNEIAATSRARGVMAIQNSRLNARSMLGSEAGMMAAHFG